MPQDASRGIRTGPPCSTRTAGPIRRSTSGATTGWSPRPGGGSPPALSTARRPWPRGILASRLDELGIDFTILYPTLGNVMLNIRDDELRRGGCRALNTYLSRVTQDHADRMTSPAIIPTHTPEEAIAELDHAIGTLGMRCMVIPDYVLRPVAARAERGDPGDAASMRVDSYAIDSEHDYDPFWARCQELGVAVTTHGGSQGMGFRQSPSLYAYNHIGQLRRGPRVPGQGPGLRRGHPALSQPPLRLPGGRRGLGGQPVLGSLRALGEARRPPHSQARSRRGRLGRVLRAAPGSRWRSLDGSRRALGGAGVPDGVPAGAGRLLPRRDRDEVGPPGPVSFPTSSSAARRTIAVRRGRSPTAITPSRSSSRPCSDRTLGHWDVADMAGRDPGRLRSGGEGAARRRGLPRLRLRQRGPAPRRDEIRSSLRERGWSPTRRIFWTAPGPTSYEREVCSSRVPSFTKKSSTAAITKTGRK